VIIGIGTDIVDIPRIAALLERHRERAVRRLYSEEEAAYCRSRAHPAASFAVRFAAKEAFYKALGTGVGSSGAWTDVEVLRSVTGAPYVRLLGAAATAALETGLKHVHVSLSHTAELATAYVVLEG
jgi:holo-[acyl-carrier protein] synthase